MSYSRWFVLCACFLGCLVLSGCSGAQLKTEAISGTVYLDDAPLENANVLFSPQTEGGFMAAGITDAKGHFQLSSLGGGKGGGGAVSGDYVVTVSKKVAEKLKTPIKHDDGETQTHTSVESLPKIYQDETNSPLKATVKRGRNSFEFKLNSK